MTQQFQISAKTSNHILTINNGTLTIEGDEKMLKPDETLILFDILLIWRFGLEEISGDIEG